MYSLCKIPVMYNIAQSCSQLCRAIYNIYFILKAKFSGFSCKYFLYDAASNDYFNKGLIDCLAEWHLHNNCLNYSKQ